MNYFDVKEFEDLLLKWQTVASEENHENKTILWVATTSAKFKLMVVFFFVGVPPSTNLVYFNANKCPDRNLFNDFLS